MFNTIFFVNLNFFTFNYILIFSNIKMKLFYYLIIF